MNKCKYECGRDQKHEHQLLFHDGKLVDDNSYKLKDEQGYEWSGKLLPVYSIWLKTGENIGRVFNGEIEINEEGKFMGYTRELYVVE